MTLLMNIVDIYPLLFISLNSVNKVISNYLLYQLLYIFVFLIYVMSFLLSKLNIFLRYNNLHKNYRL